MPLTYSAEVSLRVYAPNTSGVYAGFDPRTPEEITQGLKPLVPLDSIETATVSPLQPQFGPILNDYDGASAAYSLRRLSSNYAGNCIRVRRGVDNTEQDIGFVGNQLDVASLETFCSGSDGFISVWYDQAGSYNAVNTNTNSQPKIHESASGVIKSSGKPAVYFNGTNNVLSTGYTPPTTFSVFGLQSFYSDEGGQLIGRGDGDPDLINRAVFGFNNLNQVFLYRGGDVANVSDDLTPGRYLIYALNTPLQTTCVVGYDGNSFTGVDKIGSGEFRDIVIGAEFDQVSFYGRSEIQEIVIFPSDQSGSRSGIEANINAFYSVGSPGNARASSGDVTVVVESEAQEVSLPVYAHDSTEVTSGSSSVITTDEFNDTVKEIQPAVDAYKTVTIDPYRTESKDFTLDVLPVIVVSFRFSVDTTEVLYDKYDWIDVAVNRLSVLEHDESRGNSFAPYATHWQNGSRPNASAQVISSASNQYTLPTVWGGNYDFTVDWGDGSTDDITSWDQAEVTHTYATGGVYDISIVGKFEGVNFHRHVGADGTGGTGHMDCRKLLNLYSWGTETILDLSSAVPFHLDPANPNYSESYTFYAPDASPPSNGENRVTGLPFNGCVNWNSLAEAPPRFGYVPGTAVVKFNTQDFTGRCFSGSDTAGIFMGNNSLDCDLSNWGTTQFPLTGSMYGQFKDRAPKYGDVKANWVFEGTTGYQAWQNTPTPKEDVLSITATVTAPPSNGGGVISAPNTDDHIGLTDTIGNLPLGVYAVAVENLTYQNYSTNFDLTNWDIDDSNRSPFVGLTAFDGDTTGLIDSDVYDINNFFNGCRSFTGKGVETWDTSQIRDVNPNSRTGFSGTLSGCKSFNKPVSHFVLGTVRKDEAGVGISSMLSGCTIFNQDCSPWDVSYVATTSSLFSDCTVYDNAGVDWTDADWSKCASFGAMFRNCLAFNRDISRWKTPVNTSLYHTFRNAESFNKPVNTHTVDGEKYWDVSNVTTLRETFRDAEAFNQPLNEWDVSNVTNFYYTFANARKFNQDLSNWDVSKGTNFEQIFNVASSFDGDISTWRFREDGPIISHYMLGNTPCLYEDGKDLSGWNTGQFNSMFAFFYRNSVSRRNYWNEEDPSKLTYLGPASVYYYPNWSPNIGGWDVGNVETFASCFYQCGTFNDDLSGWNVSSATVFSRMFHTCFLFDRNLSSWDVSSGTDFSEMFYECDVFNNGGDPGIDNWDVSNAVDLEGMFYGSHRFNQPIGSWDTSSNTNMYRMFRSATDFNQDIGGWDVSNVTNMNETFLAADSFNQNLSSWDVSSVTDSTNMFSSADNFNNGGDSGIDNWDVSNVTKMPNMFRDSAFNQPIGSWDISSCTDISGMFYSTHSFNQPLNSWDTSNVTDMETVFNGSGTKHNFNQPLSNWDTSKVTNMSQMFRDCRDFNHPLTTNGNKWDVSKVTTLNLMFRSAQSFDQDLSSWNLNSATNIQDMFLQSGMSKANLDTTLQAWCANSSMASGLNLGQIPLEGGVTLDPVTTAAMSDKGMTATYVNGNSVY